MPTDPQQKATIGYHNVQRTWNHQIVESRSGQGPRKDETHVPMLQRWLQEEMKDQPYHAIGAVAGQCNASQSDQ
jgi:hypothetical protein